MGRNNCYFRIIVIAFILQSLIGCATHQIPREGEKVSRLKDVAVVVDATVTHGRTLAVPEAEPKEEEELWTEERVQESAFFQVSLFNPVQIFNEERDISGIRGSLLYGKNRNVRGLDLFNFGVARSENFSGLAVCLYYCIGGNWVEKDAKGVQITEVNYVGNNAKGVQIAGVNYVGNNAKGFQLGSGNWVDNQFSGLQMGVINRGHEVRGVQVGGINYAYRMKGVQIGVINIIQTGILPFLPVINASWEN